MIKILQNENIEELKILRNICSPVTNSEFGSEGLLILIARMKEAMEQDSDGVALACPQIGINKRIFVIHKDKGYAESAKWRPEVFINPRIIDASKKEELKHEGCLSVRGLYGDTWRAVKVTIEAYDENGHKFIYGASGITSHIAQHEIDHLDGVLFVDHGTNMIEDANWRDRLEQNDK
jgi:peptide deformylase